MIKDIIAKRIAQEFKNGFVINLGIGLPTASANYIPEGVKVILQTENGGLLFGKAPTKKTFSSELGNAAGQPITLLSGASLFDLATSFSIIRGGHVDVTVLGALEVDQEGSIANWSIPGVKVPGMGGAMDLVFSAKQVIAALNHVDKNGNSKIKKKLTLPLTGTNVLNKIITDMAVFNVVKKKLILIERAPGISIEDIKEKTEADFIISKNIKEMQVI